MPKGMRELPGEEEEAGPSGVINPRQAEDHKQCMEQAVKELQEKAKEEEITEIMELFINKVKFICADIRPQWKVPIPTKYYTPWEAPMA